MNNRRGKFGRLVRGIDVVARRTRALICERVLQRHCEARLAFTTRIIPGVRGTDDLTLAGL